MVLSHVAIGRIHAEMRLGTLQVLNEASLLAETNFKNHVATNIFSRTRHWLAYQVLSLQHPFLDALPKPRLQSWLTLLVRASTGSQASITSLLPSFTSLAQPPQDVLQALQALVHSVRQQMGPLPLDAKQIARQPTQYLPWLYKVLIDLSAAQEPLLASQTQLHLQLQAVQQQQQPQLQLQQLQLQQLTQNLRRTKLLLRHTRLFTMLPQKGNQQQFVTITTAGLHR